MQWIFKINLVVLPKREKRTGDAGNKGTGSRIKVMSAQYVPTDMPKDPSVLWRWHEGCYLHMMDITDDSTFKNTVESFFFLYIFHVSHCNSNNDS